MSKTTNHSQVQRERGLRALFAEIIKNLQSDKYKAALHDLKALERGTKTVEEFEGFLNQDGERHPIRNRLLKAILYNPRSMPKATDPRFVDTEILRQRIDMVELLLNKGLNPCYKDVSSLRSWKSQILSFGVMEDYIASLSAFNRVIASQSLEEASMMVSKVSLEFKIYAEEMAEVIRQEIQDRNYSIGPAYAALYKSAQSAPWGENDKSDNDKKVVWTKYILSDVFKNGMILHSKILNTSLEDFRICILLGANIRSVNQYGQTVLEFAISNNMLEAVEILIQQGIEINEPNPKGQTPLHIAANHNGESSEMMEFLLSRGADANARDINGATPLHLAAKSDSVAKLALLLLSGADINATDNKGLTALDYTLTFLKYQGDRGIGIGEEVATFSQHIIADYLGNEASYPDDVQFLASLDAIKFLINQGAYYNDHYISRCVQYYPTEVHETFDDAGRDRGETLLNAHNISSNEDQHTSRVTPSTMDDTDAEIIDNADDPQKFSVQYYGDDDIDAREEVDEDEFLEFLDVYFAGEVKVGGEASGASSSDLLASHP